MIKTWGLRLAALLGVLTGAVFVVGWLAAPLDKRNFDPHPADVARAEVLAADSLMSLTPPGWLPNSDIVGGRPARPGDVSNTATRRFTFAEQPDNIAAELLVVLALAEQLGWTEFYSTCRGLDSSWGTFTAVKVIDGARAWLDVEISHPNWYDMQATVEISALRVDLVEVSSPSLWDPDISCLEAAAQDLT